jgi:hypothetical protein
MLANDLPPWKVVFDQVHRWLKAGVSDMMVHDLREVI